MNMPRKRSLEAILRENVEVRGQTKDGIQRAIAYSVSTYLGSHDIIASPQIETTVRKLMDDGTIRKLKYESPKFKGKMSTYTITDYVTANPHLVGSDEFDHMSINDAASKVIGDKHGDATLKFSFDFRNKAEPLRTYAPNCKISIFYKDETKMLERVRKMIGIGESETIVRYPVTVPSSWNIPR
jgi:hypothetical protein